jgi:predicted DNA-binding protein
VQQKGEKAKSRKLFVRLTPEEYERLERLAEQEDRPVSSVVRMALRKALGPPEKPKPYL